MAFSELVNSERVNAVVGWAMIAIVALGAAESLLTTATLWGGLSLFIVAVASLPALTTRNWKEMVSWPVLSVAAVAVVARAIDVFSEIAGYVAIASLALVIVVEVDVFTPVELSNRFAVVFAVLTTMAIEALWIVAQFFSDTWLGTRFLRSQTELQEDIVIVTVVGFAVGGVFYWYFTRFEPVGAVDRPANHARTR
ncbi:hypothetical protein DMJ13_26790 [halophilic archaeon]|nr:hypothetical protein DMJ13_26790 [halophilic archaeon]